MKIISSISALKERLAQKTPGDVLLDVRSAPEFELGHIPGAVSFPVSSPEFGSKIKDLDKSKNYIVYCQTGGRAVVACAQMAMNGLDVTLSIKGYSSW